MTFFQSGKKCKLEGTIVPLARTTRLPLLMRRSNAAMAKDEPSVSASGLMCPTMAKLLALRSALMRLSGMTLSSGVILPPKILQDPIDPVCPLESRVMLEPDLGHLL